MGTEIHSNKLRSHCQFAIKDERKLTESIIGKKVMEESEKELMGKILERVPEDDKTERKFEIRWVLSCYVVYSEIKPVKEKPKKVAKKNVKDKKTVSAGKGETEKAETKRAMGDAIKDIVKENKLPKSLEIKENRVTSQNLITTDYMDLEKNVVQAVM